jgi:hypothetical protein
MTKLFRLLKLLQYAELVVKTMIPLVEKLIQKDVDGDGHIGDPK